MTESLGHIHTSICPPNDPAFYLVIAVLLYLSLLRVFTLKLKKISFSFNYDCNYIPFFYNLHLDVVIFKYQDENWKIQVSHRTKGAKLVNIFILKIKKIKVMNHLYPSFVLHTPALVRFSAVWLLISPMKIWAKTNRSALSTNL